MTDPTARDLIQRLADALEGEIDNKVGWGEPDYDGELIAEARAYLAQQESEGPTDEELMKQACKELGYEYTPQMLNCPVEGIGCLDALPEELVSLARAVLARWGCR